MRNMASEAPNRAAQLKVWPTEGPRSMRFPMENVETARPVPVSTIASTPAAPAKAPVALADRVRACSLDDPVPLAVLGPLPTAEAQRAQRTAHALRTRWTSGRPETTSAPSARSIGPLATFPNEVIVRSPISPPCAAYLPAASTTTSSPPATW